MKNSDILIRNAHIIDPANEIDAVGHIRIASGVITDISFSDDSENCDAMTIIDAQGLVAAPGLVDVHVHFRDPGQTYKEDIHTGSCSALKGGYTSVVLMANTVPTVDCPEILKDILDRAKQENLHIYSCCTVTKGMKGCEQTNLKLMKECGAAGFTDDGKPVLDEKLIRKICSDAAELSLPVSLHEEDPKYISENGVNAGPVAQSLGLKGSPRIAEISLIERDLKIAGETGVILNIQHISTREGVQLVREAKSGNPKIHAEATPHHFSLTEDAVREHGTLAKMNPPLREEADRKAIIEGLKDGTIDIIATDHAPHSKEEKARDFALAPSGIIGLETALALGVTNLVDTGSLSLYTLIERMSLNPARLYGLNAGTLSVGAPADIVIFDPKEKWRVGKSASKSSNSPFIGEIVTGKVKYTITDGKVAYHE